MVNPKYLKGLSAKEQKIKKENIKKSKALFEKGKKEEAAKIAEKRPTVKKGKRSTYTEQIKKKFPNIKVLTKDFFEKTGIPIEAQREIIDKGKAAFITSGSRASVSSPTQWGIARLYAFYIKGIKGILNFDKEIVKKYKIKFKK